MHGDKVSGLKSKVLLSLLRFDKGPKRDAFGLLKVRVSIAAAGLTEIRRFETGYDDYVWI